MYLWFIMCDDMNTDKCIIKCVKMHILVLFRFKKIYRDTMNAFITQLGIYRRDYRVYGGANTETTTTTTLIDWIITFVGSYYNKDFHFPTNVVVITFVGTCVGSGYLSHHGEVVLSWDLTCEFHVLF